jgi:chromosome segregation ATPase
MKKFFMSLLWVLLFAALGAMYIYQTSFDKRLINMNDRAKEIEDKYQVFTDDQHDFDVRLIGQRKHINQNSQRFFDLQDELKRVRDQHSSDMFYVNTRIDSLASIVNANQITLRNRINDVDSKVNSLRLTVTQNNVRATQQLQDIMGEIEKLQAQITHLDTTTQKLRRR